MIDYQFKIPNKKRSNRTTTICYVVEPISATRTIVRYLPLLFSLTYSLTTGIKPSVQLIRQTNQWIRDYKRIKYDNEFRGKREKHSESIAKNWEHIDKCYPVHGVNQQIAESNKHIRGMLNDFF